MTVMSFLLGLFVASVAHADSQELSTLHLINKAVADLRNTVTPGIICRNEVGKICSFKDFCKGFEGNETKETLYENEFGERIVNGHLMGLAQQLNSCKQGIDEKIQKRLKKQSVVKLRKELFAQAKSLNATNDLIQLELALNQYMADLPEDPADNKQGNFSSEYWIAKAERENKIQLPDSIKTKLNQYLKGTEYNSYKDVKTDSELDGLNLQFSDDPYIDPASFVQKKKAKDPNFLKDFDNKSKRVGEVFEETQGRIIKFLEKNRTQDNSIEIDQMIERIKLVKLSEKPMLRGCPNAVFHPEEYQISVCPSYYIAPELTLMKVLGHELSHSIDPCGSLLTPKKKSVAIQSCPANGSCTNLVGRDPFETIKVITKNPFSKVIHCLSTKNSVWAMNPEEHIVNRQQRLKEHLMATDQNELLDDLKKYNESEKALKAKFCSSTESNSQLGESFSDWVSAEIIGEKISELEEKNRISAALRAKESLMSLPANECANVKKHFKDLRRKINTELKCENNLAELESLESREDPHPFGTARINRIFLAQPQIKKSLGCSEDPGVTHCENDM